MTGCESGKVLGRAALTSTARAFCSRCCVSCCTTAAANWACSNCCCCSLWIAKRSWIGDLVGGIFEAVAGRPALYPSPWECRVAQSRRECALRRKTAKLGHF